MSTAILQFNFRFSGSPSHYEQAISSFARDFENVPGLLSRVSMMNDAKGEAGELFLFDDANAMHAFQESPIASQLTGHPMISHVNVKQFTVIEFKNFQEGSQNAKN